jgi:flavin-dependent dehydrogenase
MLRSLAVETQFISQGHVACHGTLSAWGSSELVAHDFIVHPEGCGYHLDRQAFDVLLLDAAEAAGAVVFRDARARIPEVGLDRVRLHCALKGRALSLAARVFVDASGRAAVVARTAGARRVPSDGLVAVTSLLVSPAPSDEDSRSLIEAVPYGWWYSALLAKGRVAIFFTDADLPALASVLSEAGWLAALQQTRHLRELIQRHAYRIAAGPRVAVANSARLSAFYGPGWLAAGDAALSYDPLSGRGIVAAMKWGKSVATTVATLLAGERDAGARYSVELEQSCLEYQSNLRRHYAAEGRWSASEFWRRRNA